MKKLIIAILFLGHFSYAQEKIPFIDYTEIEKQISETSEKGDARNSRVSYLFVE